MTRHEWVHELLFRRLATWPPPSIEEVIEQCKIEAQFLEDNHIEPWTKPGPPPVDLVIGERETCAKIADTYAANMGPSGIRNVANEIAAAIRGRK
jgi:hypothetical protein